MNPKLTISTSDDIKKLAGICISFTPGSDEAKKERECNSFTADAKMPKLFGKFKYEEITPCKWKPKTVKKNEIHWGSCGVDWDEIRGTQIPH